MGAFHVAPQTVQSLLILKCDTGTPVSPADSADSVTPPHQSFACAGVYFVPAFEGLLAPHWRGDARGVIVGLSSYTNKAHIVRALLQAICWQVKHRVHVAT